MTSGTDSLPAQDLASQAKLRYVDPNTAGIQRKPWGRGFTYLDADGEIVRDEEFRARVAALAIPPAWTEVWICADPKGHIQVTGRDARGRKQYRYHPRWEEVSNQHKFDRLLRFGELLPYIRETTSAHLRKKQLSREKVLAAVIKLLEKTLIRIGNAAYMNDNGTYGLTTLQDDHVEINGTRVIFEFQGKSGKQRSVDLQSRQLARIVKACQEIPGYHLFQYYDAEGRPQPIYSEDVNQYLRGITGEDLSAKDFRTWGGSVLAVETFAAYEGDLDADGLDADARQKLVPQGVKAVAAGLGNTAAVCRAYYIHPAILESFVAGELPGIMAKTAPDDDPHGLSPAEQALMQIIAPY